MFDPNTLVQHFRYFGLFLLLLLGEIGLPFPEDAILLLSGFLVAQGMMKPIPTFLVVYLGILITDFLLYVVGRKYGRRVVEHKRFHKMLTPETIMKLEEKFNRWGSFVILLGRHVLGLRAQIFLVAGVMRMSPIKFLIVDGFSALGTIGLWGVVGYLGGNSLQVLRKDITRVEHVVIVTLAVLLAGGSLFWYFKNKRARWKEPDKKN
jgi:membrane protein DedA with SNARE-associated domain